MRIFRPLSILLVFFFLAGCAAKIPHKIVPDYGKRGMKLVVVLPPKGEAAGPKAVEMLRARIAEELYFKGYPKVSFQAVDEALAQIAIGADGKVSPRSIGERIKVDAVLYTTIHESRTRRLLFYAPTTVDLEFELRSVKTGETLWQVRHRTTERNYGFTGRQLELKSSQIYEAAILEVLNRALETLPESTDAIMP